MFSRINKINKTTKINRTQPMFETLEDRRLQSATPLNYQGQYVTYDNNGARYEIDFTRSTTSTTKYTGDVKSAGLDLKLTATESSNKLTGNIKETSGKLDKFSAVLVGRDLTLTIGSNKVVYQKRIKALTNHSVGGLFQYDAPTGWTAKANTGGLLIQSSDHTQQVSVVSGVSSGWVAPQALVSNAVNHGTHVKKYQSSPVYNLGGGIYMADELVEVTFNVGKVNYTSDVIIASVYNGYYNITKVGMASITAPTSVFASKANVMVDVLLSIRQLPAGVTPSVQAQMPAATTSNINPTPTSDNGWDSFGYGYTVTDGFYDPGVEGNWAYGYTTAWVSPFVAAEQVSQAELSNAYEASNNAWHETFMND